MPNNVNDIIDRLSDDISSKVGNDDQNSILSINDTFQKSLSDVSKHFNSELFDNDGFIKKMRDIDLGNKKDQDMVKNVLNNLKHEYIDVQALNHSELLVRRDLFNICTQMPEMRDVIYVVRDAIIECNVSTGEVSRSITFENHDNNDLYEAQVKDIEKRYDLLMAIKNFIIPKLLMIGEMYIHVVPYAKIFAELDAIKELSPNSHRQGFRESIPNHIKESFTESKSLYTDANLKLLLESASPITKIETSDIHRIENNGNGTINAIKPDNISKTDLTSILENIQICNGSSIMLEELGAEGLKNIIYEEYMNNKQSSHKEKHFTEAMSFTQPDNSKFDRINEDDIDTKSYQHIKGCYIKYLDGLKIVPIRMDRKVIGYYYVTTTMDLQNNPANPNGIVDLSYQHYTRDRNLVDNLANMIIKSFDKKMLEKNIKLKSEIAEIIMEHKFSEGKLSFIYIPENEIIRLVINEDEYGKGHSILEPTIFPARMYLMLTLYNMLYTLNNNTTRIHYLRSSGLDKNYAAQIQRRMQQIQSRRITIDDIYSYSGVLNKVGGIGEMVMPTGRGDVKALETDTIEAVNNPMSIEFLEQQRRQAISGTGVPHLLVINAIDEVDFAKTLEMSNARFISTASAYKIDSNKGITRLYQTIMRYSTDIEEDIIMSFRFQFNAIKQQELNITADMIQNFNNLVETVSSLYYNKADLEDEKGNPSIKQMILRKELAKDYLPQLDFDSLEEIVKRVEMISQEDILQQKVGNIEISKDEIDRMMK